MTAGANGASNYEYCDLVMKGGITSGVIYPKAAAKLATRYRFKNIGGTSAGAIAAAVTAAAEFGRRSGNANAFDVLDNLPADLASDGHLLKLFTPDIGTSKVFGIALGLLAGKSWPDRIWKIVKGAALVSPLFFLGTLLGVATLPTLAFSLVRPYGIQGVPGLFLRHYLVCSIVGLLPGLIAALIVALVLGGRKALDAIVSNGFGMVSGMAAAAEQTASLTTWIHQQIQTAAGLDSHAAPLTFGDLWSAKAYSGETLQTEKAINLQVVTTGLSHGQPFSIPFLGDARYFDQIEWAKLFPPDVLQWLIQKGQACEPEGKRPVVASDVAETRLFRLPNNEELPILVATRMSLSFPGLLSAVPLYTVNYGLVRNQDGKTDCPTRVASRIWFSDGGICSNFPVNFFDSAIPRWPTFAINLKQADTAKCTQQPRKAADFVNLPRPVGAAATAWNSMGDAYWQPNEKNADTGKIVNEDEPSKRLLMFAQSIMNTMQNWRDNLQAASPGYRDRIVAVSLCSDEGGLNLNMPDSLITALSDRGEEAANKLIDPNPKTGFDFSQHIFTRFRISLSELQSYLNSLRMSMEHPAVQDDLGLQYIEGKQEPPHYCWAHQNIADRSAEAIEELISLSAAWESALTEQDGFSTGAPRPLGDLRGTPRF
jgi:predicted acylesterase/phospholipase RssA